MVKSNWKFSLSVICAFVFSMASILSVAPGAFGQDSVDLKKWTESSSRKAGTRQTVKVGKVEIGLVWIPAGEFDMGSPKTEQNRRDNEEQIHVKLTRGYWMLETEVAQALYQEVMGENPSSKKGKFLPVERVDWNDATKFCEEMTKRLPEGLTASLPTEAQWEYACRAGTKTAYSYGNKADPTKMNCESGSTPVKSYPANAWGLYDMHGNVYEWVRDIYVESYSGEYGLGTVSDPECSDADSDYPLRVYRGGGFGFLLDGSCRSADRVPRTANDHNVSLGFRFILTCD